MATILDYYKYAYLATAAYVRMGEGALTGGRLADLANTQSGGRIPLSIARRLFDPQFAQPGYPQWQILYYYGGDRPEVNDKSGFAATLFQQGEGGEYVLAIRGVEPTVSGVEVWRDLLGASIGGIGQLGIALSQAVDMINLIQRLYGSGMVKQIKAELTLTPPTDPNARVITLQGALANYLPSVPGVPVPIYLSLTSYEALGDGVLSADDKITLTGHSLGGHLALVAAQLFGDKINPDVYVYNSAGFDPVTVDLAAGATLRAPGFGAALLGLLGAGRAALGESLGYDALFLSNESQQASAEIIDGLRSILGTPSTMYTVHNLESEDSAPGDDTSVVASVFTDLSYIGSETLVGTEVNSHSIEQLMDALALQTVFYRIDESLTLPEIKTLLDAAQNIPGRSEETLLVALHKLLIPASQLAGYGLQLPVSDASEGLFDLWSSKGKIDARDAFHRAILELNDRLTEIESSGVTLRIESLLEKTENDLILAATNNDPANTTSIAYRYALKELNPFAVIGVDYQGAHNANSELDRYPKSETGQLTQSWIADRAAFLASQMAAFAKDTNAVMGSENRQYIDLATGSYVYDSTEIDDYERPEPVPDARRFVFGGDRGDIVEGDVKDDHLYGGAGNDILRGAAGTDYLEGGAGLDVYQYGASKEWADPIYIFDNDGADTILDTDGRGVLRYVLSDSLAAQDAISVIANAPIQLSETEWQSLDGDFLFTRLAGDDGRTDLQITFAGDSGGSLLLKDWSEGQFHIRLAGTGQTHEYEPLQTPAIVGDLAPVDADEDAEGVQLSYDPLGNVETDPGQPQPGRADTLFGSDGADQILSFAGNDFITGRAGDDFISGGEGSDELYGAEGFDRIYGEGGRDLVYGGADDDELYGGGDIDLLSGGNGDDRIAGQGGKDVLVGGLGNDEIFHDELVESGNWSVMLALGETQGGSNLKGEWLDGGDGNDLLAAGIDNDHLLGGAGDDVLIGGAGDDDLIGDGAGAVSDLENWKVTRVVTETAQGTTEYGHTYSGSSVSEGAGHGHDILYGGAGEDWLLGRGGDDILDGGNDDDVLFGESGDDVLVGGDGSDLLVGDNSMVTVGYGDDFLDGGAGVDFLYGNAGNDTLFGGDGADYLYGEQGDDVLVGGEEDDFLYGGDGNDTLVGGKGEDQLVGGAGSDVYVFNRGDGVEVIDDVPTDPLSYGAEASVIVVGMGISREDVEFRIGSLLIDLGPSDPGNPASEHDVIHVLGFNADDPSSTPLIAELRFFDGSVMTYGDVLNQGFDIDGTDENDDGTDPARPQLVGTGVTDRIRGLGGNDVLAGLGGDDVLDGGEGADQLQGGAGNDHYLIDASDKIVDAEGSNSLEFVDDTTIDDVQVIRTVDGIDEYLGFYIGTHGLLVIDPLQPAFVSFAFSDGTALSYEELLGAALTNPLTLTGSTDSDTLNGNAGNDQINGIGGNDILLGYGGDDIVDGGAGADLLAGGRGNDELRGGEGSDTYAFFAGDGQDLIMENGDSADVDVISFAEGISSADVTVERLASGNLSVTLSSGDSVGVRDYYNNPRARVEALVFSDGTVIDAAVLDALEVPPIVGTTGNDTLTGTDWADTIEALAGDDVLIGGRGDDVLKGGEGADTYLLSLLSGRDTLIDVSAETNTIEIGDGFLVGDLYARRDGDNLVLGLRSSNDAVVLSDYYIAPQQWVVSDSSGQFVSPDDVVAATQLRELDTLQTLWDDYRNQLKADAYREFGNLGYAAVSTTRLEKQSLEGFYATVFITDQFTEETFEQVATGETSVVTSSSRSEQWSLYNPLIIVDSVSISEVQTVSDAPAIIPVGGTFSQAWSESSVAAVDWDQPLGTSDQTITNSVALGETFNLYTQRRVIEFEGTADANFLGFSQAPADTLGVSPQFSDTQPDNIRVIRSERAVLKTIEMIIAGDSDNTIQAYFSEVMVDAGGGNDVVNGAGFQIGGDGNDRLWHGVVLIGGNGDDELFDGETLIGGPGNDVLDGSDGADTYEVILGEPGVDLVRESGGYKEEFLDAYYVSIGIPEWQARRNLTRTQYVVVGDPDAPGFGSKGDVEAFLDSKYEWTLDEALASGFVQILDPLPGLPVSGANDYAGLQQFYDAGLIDLDTVVFDAGIDIGSLTFSWGESVVNLADPEDQASGSLHATLDITWGAGQAISVVIPRSGDPIGSGVELFQFGEGEPLSLSEMIALAPPPPDFDLLTELLGTAGPDEIVGTSADELILGFGGDDQLFGEGGNDRIVGGDGDDALEGGLGNDHILGGAGDDYAEGGEGNDRIEGGEGNDDLNGSDGFDTFVGGPGDDQLAGDDGGDTYIFNRGDGYDSIYDDSGSDTLQFGVGIAPEDVLVTDDPEGFLYFVFPDSPDRIQVANWIDGFGSGHFKIESVRFSDGTVWDTNQTESRIQRLGSTEYADVVVGTAGDDTISGLGGGDRLFGLGGDDYLSGNDGNDRIYGGNPYQSTPPATNILFGGAGNDAVIGSRRGWNYVDGGAGDDDVSAGGSEAIGFLVGGLGNDDLSAFGGGPAVVAFNRGDGADQIDFNNNITISLGSDLSGNALALRRSGDDIVLEIGTADSIQLNTRYLSDPASWPSVTLQLFQSGIQQFDLTALMRQFREATDSDPVLSRLYIGDQLGTVLVGSSVDFAVGGDLAYAYATNGSVDLPAPAIRAVLNDADFGINPQYITPSGGDGAPTVALPLADALVLEDEAFSFLIPDGSFGSPNPGDVLAFTAALANSSPIPDWLVFEPGAQTFSGIPGDDDVGSYEVRVTALNTAGQRAADVFTLTVENVNDQPVIESADSSGMVVETSDPVYVPSDETLLINGDFESGDFTGWDVTNAIGGTFVFGVPHTGAYGVVSLARGTPDLLAQTVPTDADARYLLSFWLKGGVNPVGPPGVKFDAIWNDTPVLSLDTIYLADFTLFEVEVTGIDGVSELVLALQNDLTPWYLDDVVLAPLLVSDAIHETSGLITFSDVDANDMHLVTYDAKGEDYVGAFEAELLTDRNAGQPGTAQWRFQVNDSEIAYLGEGQTLTQAYDVIVDDGLPGGTTTQTVTVTINGAGAGANTAPVAVDDTISAQEDGDAVNVSLAALVANDTDADAGDTLTVTAVSATASGAQVTLGADFITYDPGTLFEELAAGVVASDSFMYTISDAFGETATATVTVEVTGTNDDPFVVALLEDQTATEETGFAYTIPAGAFDDVDNGDVLTLSATLGSGKALPAWLQFDPATGAFAGTPLPGDVGLVNVRVTATDSAAASVSQDFNLDVRFLNRNIFGTAVADTLLGGGGQDTIGGGGGNDLLRGGAGDDTYVFNVGDGIDTIVDISTPDETNTLVFGQGITPDMLSLSLGSLVISVGDNGDAVHLESFDGNDPFNTIDVRRFRFSDGTEWDTSDLLSLGIAIDGTDEDDWITGTLVNDFINGFGGRDVMAGGTGDDTFFVDDRYDVVVEHAGEGIDLVNSFVSYTLGDNVENLTIIGTEKKVKAIGNAADNVLTGNGKDNTLIGLAGDDWLDGGAGGDKLVGGPGNDTYVVDKTKDVIVEKVNQGLDTVRSSVKWTLHSNLENLILVGTDAIDGKGNALANLLVGNSANNKLSSKSGNDIVQGMAGDDKLINKSGTALIDGGIGSDTLAGSKGNELFIGGHGDDSVSAGSGADIFAFNLGDGQDSVQAKRGADNTLSLGGGIGYADLSLTRHRKDLLLNIGPSDSISLLDWYASDSKHSVLNLQVIAEAMAEFDAAGSDPLLDNKVETFDFAAIASAFDAAGQVSNWALTDALLDAHLAGSDSEALGGDLAYQYGVNGSLTGIGVTAAQDVLNAPQFGSDVQTLHPLEELQQGQARLS